MTIKKRITREYHGLNPDSFGPLCVNHSFGPRGLNPNFFGSRGLKNQEPVGLHGLKSDSIGPHGLTPDFFGPHGLN